MSAGASVASAGWLVFGASVRGPEHERDDGPCQDASAWSVTEGGAAVVCVCDGAGSASHARIGALAAARAAVEALGAASPWLAGGPSSERAVGAECAGERAVEGVVKRPVERAADRPVEHALREACAAGRRAIDAEAAARALAPRDLACTLVLVAAWDDVVAVAHLGDGAVVGRRSGSGALAVLSEPDRGEFANETWFLTSADWQERVRVTVEKGIDAFCALTDGCQSASLVRGAPVRPFQPFCEPLFDFAREVTDAGEASEEVMRLLESEAMRRSSGDDKTLVVAQRRPGAEALQSADGGSGAAGIGQAEPPSAAA